MKANHQKPKLTIKIKLITKLWSMSQKQWSKRLIKKVQKALSNNLNPYSSRSNRHQKLQLGKRSLETSKLCKWSVDTPTESITRATCAAAATAEKVSNRKHTCAGTQIEWTIPWVCVNVATSMTIINESSTKPKEMEVTSQSTRKSNQKSLTLWNNKKSQNEKSNLLEDYDAHVITSIMGLFRTLI